MAALDDLLATWHCWARGYRLTPDIHSSPLFARAQSPRGWDTVQEIVEHEIDGATMEAIDFHVSELQPAQRTAIQINARNLATGHHVWTSARLPVDQQQRAILVRDARQALAAKLISAGILTIAENCVYCAPAG